MPSPFGRADRGTASELSVATTAFVPGSQLGGGASGSATAPDALAAALAATGSPSPAPKVQPSAFQDALPYRTQAESSVVSDWKLHYWHDGGKGVAMQRGLRFQDLRYATNTSPGVCVLKQQDDVPKVAGINGVGGHFAPTADKQKLIDSVTKQLLQMGVVLHDPHTKHESATAPQERGNPSSSPGMGRRSGSEASLASHHERRKHLPAVVARDRYQKYVVAKPKKGHRFCEPEGHE